MTEVDVVVSDPMDRPPHAGPDRSIASSFAEDTRIRHPVQPPRETPGDPWNGSATACTCRMASP